MEPEQVSNPQTDATKSAEQQLADIKSQASKIVQQAQKISPNTNFVSEADAEMIGLPRLNVPTQGRQTPVSSELDRVGSTTIPKTGTDKAREALLSQVPEEDQATISAILDASMGLQTERGAELEGDLETITAERLNLAQSAKQRATERGELLTDNRVPELEAELESIRSEADVLSAQRNAAIQREAARQGTSTQAQNANIQSIEKDFNLQQANLAIRELAAVGKVNAATRLIQTKLDIKFGDIEAETELVKAQIDSILPLLSREDKKVAEQRLMLNQVAQNTIEDAREADKVLEEFKLQSYMNAQANGATPALLSMIMSSDNREDVLSVGGSFVEDPMAKLDRQVKSEQIRTEQARQEEIYNDINPGDTVNTPAGGQISVPTFDEFISGKEQEAMQSFTKERREEFRKEYQDEVDVMSQAARVASLSPFAQEVVNNPQRYYDFTPTVRQEVFEEMANRAIDTKALLSGKKKQLPATQADNFTQARGVKNDVEKLYTMLQTLPGTGPISGRLQALDPYHPKRVAIDAQITRIIPGLARGIFNEVGVLTDQDMDRYQRTIANPNMTEQQIEQVHNDTLQKIDQSIETALETFGAVGYDVSGLQDLVNSTTTTPDNLSEDEAYEEYLRITGN